MNTVNMLLAYLKAMKSNEKGQFAVDIALGLAVVLIISAFIILPGLRDISSTMMVDIKAWWTSTIKTKVFSTT